jgi:6-phosphogluconolactonase
VRLLLGGYTADMEGSATGIGMLLAGAAEDGSAGGSLTFTGDAAAAASPSWLAPHPALDVVYAALERRGAVQAFRRTGEASFAPLGRAVPAGEAACHVAVAPDGRSLLAACWGDGRVVRMSLDDAGVPSDPVVLAAASDPLDETTQPGGGDIDLAAAARALREAAGPEFTHLVPDHDGPSDTVTVAAASDRPSRAHQSLFLPTGVVATTDLGLDLVRFWRPTASGLRPGQQVMLPAGSGPRHMVWHPSGHLYVVTELSREVFALAAGADGHWRIAGGVSLGAGATFAGDTAAELAASRDGGFLYAGVRGSDTIATIKVRGAGETLEPVALVEAGVGWPRHHAIVRDTLLVAGERSNEVASLSLDLRTGVPGRVRHRTAAPSPTCLLPVAAA